MRRTKPRLLFLFPFEDSAVPIGNTNIIRSIDSRFSLHLLKRKSCRLELPKDSEITYVSENPILRAIQNIVIAWRMAPGMDIVIGNGTIRELIILPIVRLFRRPKYVMFIHTCYERLDEMRSKSMLAFLFYISHKYISRHAHARIAVSDFVKKGFVKGFGADKNSTYTVINSVDTTLFDPKKREPAFLKRFYGIKNDNKNILYLSKLTRTKRAHLIPKIARRLPQYNFIMHGRNEMGLDISARNIYFSDRRPPREDIAKIFASCDLFVFPSKVEPCAASVTEAMASGLPIVASRGGSVPEQVEEGKNAYLVDIKEGEIEEFCSRIEKLLEDDKLLSSFSEKSRRRSLMFDRSRTGEKYEKIFDNILELNH